MSHYSSTSSRGLPARNAEGPKYYYHSGPPYDPYQRAYYYPVSTSPPQRGQSQLHYRVVHYAQPAHVGTPVSNTKTVRFACEGREHKVSVISGYRVVQF
jgi:hypothetical protein